MPYSHISLSQLKGLHLQGNSFDVPEGSLELALNVVCAQDNTIRKRRGFYLFSTPAGTPNSLFYYNSTLMLVLSNAIANVNSGGTITNLTGATVDTSGLYSRSVQSNSNLYFTSNNGIMKIESPTSTVYTSGVAPAIDIQATPTGTAGVINPNVQVAYRIVYGRTDSNKNLLLSAPSDIVTVVNPKFDSTASFSAGTVTVTETAHGLSSGVVVTIFSGAKSDGTVIPMSGERTITVTDANHFTFPDTSSGISAIAELFWGYSFNVNLEATIPSEVNTTEYFYQVYRTSQSADEGTVPFADFKLVAQTTLTSTDLTNRFVTYADTISDIFLGAELYTNPNSQEGELQANTRAPLSKDVAFFKNFVFYANTTGRHQLSLNIVTVGPSTLGSGSMVSVTQGVTTRTYTGRDGVGNSRVTSNSTSVAGSTVTVNYPNHGFVNGDSIYVYSFTGTGTLTPGVYAMTIVNPNQFLITASPTLITSLTFTGNTDSGARALFTATSSSLSVAVNIQNTARALVKVINRDASSVIYARYISGFSDVPGKMFFQAKGFGAPFSVTANSTATGSAFSPTLPTSGTTVSSTNDVLPNILFVSKVGEPEAVPITNNFPVGAKNSAIIRVAALRDSLIILKDDGIYRLNGDTPDNFVVTVLDNSVSCRAENSVSVLNNQVYCMSSQGVVQISDTSASIESRAIELPLVAVLGLAQLNGATVGAAYESERLYVLTTIAPNQTTPTIAYVYNYVTKEWTQWDTYMASGIVGPLDTLFYIGTDAKIYKERKDQTRLDYCGQNYTFVASAVSTDLMTVSFAVGAVTPQVGDVVIKSNIVNRIISVSVLPGVITCTFKTQTNILSSDSVQLYRSYSSQVKFAPIHAGGPERNKQFSIFQAVFRNDSCSAMNIYFASEKFAGSEPIAWNDYSASKQGWGLEPWGLFGWGDSQLINLDYQTSPNIQARTYVPSFASRSIYIQPVLEHNQAAEAFILQSIGFAVRGYGERTVR